MSRIGSVPKENTNNLKAAIQEEGGEIEMQVDVDRVRGIANSIEDWLEHNPGEKQVAVVLTPETARMFVEVLKKGCRVKPLGGYVSLPNSLPPGMAYERVLKDLKSWGALEYEVLVACDKMVEEFQWKIEAVVKEPGEIVS